MHKHTTIALLASLGLLSACGASSSADGSAATTTASSSITASLDSAWAKAKAGENPSMGCAKVKGYAISDTSASARAALAQCNFDIPVRYFSVLLDRVDAGTLTCHDFMMTMATQLRPMTMSMGGLKHAIAKHEAGDASADAAATTAVAAAITGNASEQARSRIKASLSERVIATCPVMTMYMKR